MGTKKKTMKPTILSRRIVKLPGLLLLALIAPLLAAPATRADPLQLRDDSLVALDEARGTLAEIEAKLAALKDDMSREYRVMDDARRRKNRADELESRQLIEAMKATRDELWVGRDRARIVVGQRQAAWEAAEAGLRMHDLETSEGADAVQIQQLQRKHEKATAKASRLQREVEWADRPVK
jgi:hypothetical protein